MTVDLAELLSPFSPAAPGFTLAEVQELLGRYRLATDRPKPGPVPEHLRHLVTVPEAPEGMVPVGPPWFDGEKIVQHFAARAQEFPVMSVGLASYDLTPDIDLLHNLEREVRARSFPPRPLRNTLRDTLGAAS